MDRAKDIPFAVDRKAGRSLIEQIADGLRREIVCGHYRPGDTLPSSRALEAALGVSRIVVKAAFARLAAEGFTVPRPRVGTVVRDRGEKQWRGHVLFVCPEGDVNYGETVLACVLGNRLSEANYLFTQVSIPYATKPKRYDFARLDAALAQSVKLVVAMSYPQFHQRLTRRDVSYAVFGEFDRLPVSAVGGTRLNLNLAMPDFAAACAAEGVKEVVHLSLNLAKRDAAAALREAGVRVCKVAVNFDKSDGVLIGVKRAGMETFRQLLAEGRLRPGSVCYIDDDYLAEGALMALASAGLRAPDDIRIVTFANKRLGPIYVRDLTRMEYDAGHAGEVLADAVLEYLKTGIYPANSLVGPVWVDGETFATRTSKGENT